MIWLGQLFLGESQSMIKVKFPSWKNAPNIWTLSQAPTTNSPLWHLSVDILRQRHDYIEENISCTYEGTMNQQCACQGYFIIIISSVRSSKSHPDLLLTQHHPPSTWTMDLYHSVVGFSIQKSMLQILGTWNRAFWAWNWYKKSKFRVQGYSTIVLRKIKTRHTLKKALVVIPA